MDISFSGEKKSSLRSPLSKVSSWKLPKMGSSTTSRGWSVGWACTVSVLVEALSSVAGRFSLLHAEDARKRERKRIVVFIIGNKIKGKEVGTVFYKPPLKPTPALPKGGRRERSWDSILQTTPTPPLEKEGMKLALLLIGTFSVIIFVFQWDCGRCAYSCDSRRGVSRCQTPEAARPVAVGI